MYFCQKNPNFPSYSKRPWKSYWKNHIVFRRKNLSSNITTDVPDYEFSIVDKNGIFDLSSKKYFCRSVGYSLRFTFDPKQVQTAEMTVWLKKEFVIRIGKLSWR